jgi:membrane associated rhomboid family serine protease
MFGKQNYLQPGASERTSSVTVAILVVNVVLFLIQNALDYYTRLPIWDLFALSKNGLAHGYLWQLLTFQFMHAPLWQSGILHILVNCWAIYVFGPPLEAVLGKAGFLKLYLSSGVFGGLLQIFGSGLWPTHFGVGPVVGASAGVFGLVAAFAVLYPRRHLTLLLFFIIPLHMSAKSMLTISALLAIGGILLPGSHVAHAAHLGGMLTGVIYLRWKIRGSGNPQFGN